MDDPLEKTIEKLMRHVSQDVHIPEVTRRRVVLAAFDKLREKRRPWWSPATWTWRSLPETWQWGWRHALAGLILLLWGANLLGNRRPPTLEITAGQEYARVTPPSSTPSPSRGEGNQSPSPLMGRETPQRSSVVDDRTIPNRAREEGRVRVVTPGSTVTAQTGPITLTFPNISLAMERGSTVTVEERGTKGAALSVRLAVGTVTASVVHGTPFTVKTPLGEARAKGTEFQVKLQLISQGGYKMKRLMTVIVLAGLVEVQNGFGTMACAAGETATVEEGKAPSQADSPREEPAGKWSMDQKSHTTLDGAIFTGVKTTWHPNGQKASEETFRDGMPDGIAVFWHPNGRKKVEWAYHDGGKVVNGTYVHWYPNGQKQSEQTLRNGEMVGPFVAFHENGQKASETTFRGGHEETFWDEYGREIVHNQPITFGAKLQVSPFDKLRAGPEGLTITAITPQSPAARASLQVGDRLLTLEGQPVSKTVAAFLTQLDAYTEGSLIKLVVERKDGRHTVLLPWTRQDPSTNSGQAPVKAPKPVERPKK